MNDERMSAAELRAVWGLGGVFSLRMLGMFMVLPVLATYGMALAGASKALIGVAIGIYGLTQAVLQIPLGLLSDRLGRLPLIVGGLAVFALGSGVAALSHSIWGVIAGRGLQGAGAIAAAVMALLSDLTREQHRTKAMAFIGISFGLTFALAMVLGPLLTQALGLSALFWGIGVLALLAMALALLVVPTPAAHLRNREASMVKGSFGRVLTNPRLLKLDLGILCLHLLLMANFVALPSALESAGLDRGQQWLPYLITMLVAFASVVPFVIYAEKRRQMKRVFVCCVAMLVLAELVLWRAGGHLWGLYAGLQLFFIAFNVLEALLPSLVSKEAPAGYKGTAMGVYSTSQFLGVAIGGAVGGLWLGAGGLYLVFLGAALVAGLWWLVSLSMGEPPYVSSLRLLLPASCHDRTATLADCLIAQPGVAEAVIVAEEGAAYVKVDTRQTNRQQLEQLLSGIG